MNGIPENIINNNISVNNMNTFNNYSGPLEIIVNNKNFELMKLMIQIDNN